MATLIIYSGTDDGYITSSDATYTTARAMAGTLVVSAADGATLTVGQQESAGSYDVYETFLRFDTSALAVTPSRATLTLTAQGAYQGLAAVTIEVRSTTDWSTLDTGDAVAGASLGGLTLGATFAATLITSIGQTIQFTDVALAGTIVPGGVSAYVLTTDDQRTGTAPAGGAVDRASFRDAGTAGTASDPYLTIYSGIYVRGAGTLGTAASGNLTLTYPVVASGDRLIAVITAQDNVASTRASWTLKQGTNNGTGLRTEIWYMDAASDGTETGTLVWTRASGLASEGRIYAIAGAATSGDPIEAIAASANASSATVTFPSLTTLTNAALVIAAVSAAGVATSSTYSGTNPTFFEESDDSTDPRPVFVDSATAALGTAGLSLSITMPATAVTGDLAVVAITVKSATLTATRTGWTGITGSPFGDAASPASRTFILTHTVGAGEPGTALAFTLSGSVKAAGVMSIWRKADTTTPRNTSAGQVNASGTSSVAPTITPSAANTVAVYFTGPSTGETLTTQPTGYQQPATNFTVAATGGSGATRCGVGFGYSLYPTSGAGTGTKTGTISAATTSAGVHLAIAALNPTSNPVSMAVADDNATTAGAITGRTATLSTALVNTGVLFAIKPPAGALFLRRLVMSQAVQRAATW